MGDVEPLTDFFRNLKFSDIRLNLIDNDQEMIIPAHKLILMSTSEMFNHFLDTFTEDLFDINLKDLGTIKDFLTILQKCYDFSNNVKIIKQDHLGRKDQSVMENITFDKILKFNIRMIKYFGFHYLENYISIGPFSGITFFTIKYREDDFIKIEGITTDELYIQFYPNTDLNLTVYIDSIYIKEYQDVAKFNSLEMELERFVKNYFKNTFTPFGLKKVKTHIPYRDFINYLLNNDQIEGVFKNHLKNFILSNNINYLRVNKYYIFDKKEIGTSNYYHFYLKNKIQYYKFLIAPKEKLLPKEKIDLEEKIEFVEFLLQKNLIDSFYIEKDLDILFSREKKIFLFNHYLPDLIEIPLQHEGYSIADSENYRKMYNAIEKIFPGLLEKPTKSPLPRRILKDKFREIYKNMYYLTKYPEFYTPISNNFPSLIYIFKKISNWDSDMDKSVLQARTKEEFVEKLSFFPGALAAAPQEPPSLIIPSTICSIPGFLPEENELFARFKYPDPSFNLEKIVIYFHGLYNAKVLTENEIEMFNRILSTSRNEEILGNLLLNVKNRLCKKIKIYSIKDLAPPSLSPSLIVPTLLPTIPPSNLGASSLFPSLAVPSSPNPCNLSFLNYNENNFLKSLYEDHLSRFPDWPIFNEIGLTILSKFDNLDKSILALFLPTDEMNRYPEILYSDFGNWTSLELLKILLKLRKGFCGF